MNYKILKPHKKDCRACKAVEDGYWNTPWSGLVKEQFFADKLCRKSRGCTLWTVIGCNSTNCDGLIAINTDKILELEKK